MRGDLVKMPGLAFHLIRKPIAPQGQGSVCREKNGAGLGGFILSPSGRFINRLVVEPISREGEPTSQEGEPASPEGRIHCPEGRSRRPEDRIHLPGGRTHCPEGRIHFPGRRIRLPGRRIHFPGRTRLPRRGIFAAPSCAIVQIAVSVGPPGGPLRMMS